MNLQSRVLRISLATFVVIAVGALVVAFPASADVTTPSPNAVVNPGFEKGVDGWNWYISKADATGSVEQTQVHSGLGAFRISNRSAYGPNVYGSLQQNVTGLKPDTEYELSLWVKATNAEVNWFGGGPGWTVRQALPVSTATWERHAVQFRTGKDQTSWFVIINSDGPTEELLIDDVAVVEAGVRRAWIYAPSVVPILAGAPRGKFVLAAGDYDPRSYDTSEDVSGSVSFPLAAGYAGGRIELVARDGSGAEKPIGAVDVPAVRSASVASLPFSIPADRFTHGVNTLGVRLDGANALVASVDVTRRDIAEMLADIIHRQELRLKHVRAEAVSRKVDGNAYVRLGLNIAQRYLDRVRSPKTKELQDDSWSWLQIRETDQVLDATERLLRTPVGDAPSLTAVRPAIDRGVFVAGGSSAGRPDFWGGYGAFDQAIADIPNFPGLGASIIQSEMGPTALNADGADSGNVASLMSRFTKAAASDVKIDLLLSPHYFPQWAYDKDPAVKLPDNPGFIKFDIDNPVARQAIEQWIKRVVPAVKDQSSLFSICLSNEPTYASSGRTDYSRPLWIDYLKQTHGSIEMLNGLYGTSYTSFDSVPVPPSAVPALTEPIGKLRAYYDWATFNARHFADWHRWMNGLVKAGAPDVPTHAKIMVFSTVQRSEYNQGTDPEQFCAITDIAGNDDYTRSAGDGGVGDYAYLWQTEELSYDLLRSFHQQPVFNSENHLINDRFTGSVPSDFVRSVMWQGALHGQGATVTWVWGEAQDKKSDLYGCIYFRPADVFGAGRAWLDARRCGSQVASVIRAKPHVAILFSRTSLFWQANYEASMRAAYSALTFLGEPVTFVTEKELANGTVPPVQAIVLPQATHVGDAAVDALARFVKHGGKLIALGDGNLANDAYSRPRDLPAGLRMASLPFSGDDRKVFDQLSPIAQSLGVQGELVDAKTGHRPFGVEYRIVTDQGRTFLSAINLLRAPLTVKAPGGHAGHGQDLLSGEVVDVAAIVLNPMQPRLVDLGK
ncbi:MAG: beta-galactosidase [Capsulimonadaceae bacterium]|nr:beta-galactosidase [Capsulimonadaceae bacterium]